MVAHLTFNQVGEGSNPSWPTNKMNNAPLAELAYTAGLEPVFSRHESDVNGLTNVTGAPYYKIIKSLIV